MASFEGVLNFRDVGRTVNQFAGSSFMREGRLYRSARLDDATESDQKRLVEAYHIKTVIDLRTKSEHIKQAKERKRFTDPTASTTSLIPALQIPGLEYQLINLNGGGFEKALLYKLSLLSIIKVIFLILFGFRMQAINIIGREVMQPRGLTGLGHDSIDYCGEELRQVFDVLAEPTNYPILVHCTQGKDRTGLLIALVLFLLHVPIKAIEYDYLLSESELKSMEDIRLRELQEVGLQEDFARTPPHWVASMQSHIETKHISIEEYLSSIGFSEGRQKSIEDLLSGGTDIDGVYSNGR